MSFKEGDKVKCIDNEYVEYCFTLGETYVIDEVQQYGHIRFVHTGYTLWHPDRFELVEKEDIVQEPKIFNPQPGDKIICNNGEEFTCCTKKYLKHDLSKNMHSDKPLFGFNREYPYRWQDWYTDGKVMLGGYNDWNIREVLSKQKEQTVPEETEVEHSTFTPEDIQLAWDNLGWSERLLDAFAQSLSQVKSPEYKEYLRLKAMFETGKENKE